MGFTGIWVLSYVISIIEESVLPGICEVSSQAAALSPSPVFSVSLVYYLATVDLAPSVPDHMHSVANWVNISADLAWCQDGWWCSGLARGGVSWATGYLPLVCVKPAS